MRALGEQSRLPCPPRHRWGGSGPLPVPPASPRPALPPGHPFLPTASPGIALSRHGSSGAPGEAPPKLFPCLPSLSGHPPRAVIASPWQLRQALPCRDDTGEVFTISRREPAGGKNEEERLRRARRLQPLPPGASHRGAAAAPGAGARGPGGAGAAPGAPGEPRVRSHLGLPDSLGFRQK